MCDLEYILFCIVLFQSFEDDEHTVQPEQAQEEAQEGDVGAVPTAADPAELATPPATEADPAEKLTEVL